MSVMFHGIGVSKGIAIGQAYVLYRERPEVQEYAIAPKRIEHEIARFNTARAQAQQQLESVKLKYSGDIPQDILHFIDTHLLMLDDPLLKDGTIEHIRHRMCNAEWALQSQCDRLVKVFDEMDDPYLKTRKDDILHVVQHIQHYLSSNNDNDDDAPDYLQGEHLKGHIIIADDLTPADTLVMRHQKIAGFVTEFGGPLSHTAILARNLGIPAIIGVRNVRQLIQAGDWLVIDGSAGMLIAEPDSHSLRHFRDLQKDEKRRQQNLYSLKNKPAMTVDGKRINLNGNIDGPDDVRTLRQYDHTGVGLYRTEMLFMERDEWPSEQEQFEVYTRALRALKGHPLTIRTADLGADKEMRDTQQHGPMAHNPALGLRAIRRCLKEPHLFMFQLKAILRAAAYGPVNMMIPMLTCTSELDQVMVLMEQAKNELRTERKRFNPNLPLGAMIEVPAAALSALSFARKLDFLSIGTNDLIQYTLAMDRIDDEVSHLFKPLHPSVLKLITMTLQAGAKTGIDVSLCGEMASDPMYTRLLLGMGLHSFSVQAGSLLEIKHIINHSHLGQLTALVGPMLELNTADDIELAVNAMNRQFV